MGLIYLMKKTFAPSGTSLQNLDDFNVTLSWTASGNSNVTIGEVFVGKAGEVHVSGNNSTVSMRTSSSTANASAGSTAGKTTHSHSIARG